jgi:hypothetical protein
MSKKELVMIAIDELPEAAVDDVLEYIQSLKAKRETLAFDTALASESSLKKDWLRPEEDEAWQSL